MLSHWQRLARFAARDGDSAEVTRRKELWISLMGCLVVLGAIFEASFLRQNATSPLQGSVMALHFAWFVTIVGLAYPLATRNVPINFIAAIGALLSAASLLADLTDAAGRAMYRSWNGIILIMDLYLALQVPRPWQHLVLHATALWVLVTNVEDTFRLGLYDVEELTASNEAMGILCGCADPPCSQNWTELLRFLMPWLVLYTDFSATRHFAEGLRSEKSRIQSSVVAAEQVAEGLANFDLGAAENALEQSAAGKDIPPGLASAFRRLFENLARYRPYLPQSCFEDSDTATTASVSAGCASPRSPRRSLPGGQRPSPVSAAGSRSAYGSDKGSDAGSPPASIDGESPPLGRHSQAFRRVTVLVRNTNGFLAVARERSAAVQQWLAQEVERFTVTVSQQGGVSDLFSGDHFSAAFGAVRVQGSQCTAATRAAKALTAAAGSFGEPFRALQSTAAVCCGQALCGDCGSTMTQRYMVIGGVSAFVLAAERAASAWAVGVLIGPEVHAEAELLWCTRLRKMAIYPKLRPQPIPLWEVLAECAQPAAGEWMYELEARGSNPWQKYNTAVRNWSAAAPREEVLQVVAVGLDSAAPGGEVAHALHALRHALQVGAAAPVGDFMSAALAGEPSPVSIQDPFPREQEQSGKAAVT
eukprot:TRINITY_DN7500_c0_g1_i2.p1 TRINITY_DN7500_c0_g1~~TRINITY_DN7500_c0_g1_i2.p1  ORF type:complete len:646 (+),score=136.41 TRINITY_DN7500_c0_g1_i2:126-2063(+)